MGLGDTLYMQSIARHLVGKGEIPEVCTKFPEVFDPLEGEVILSPFRRGNVDKVCHYVNRKRIPDTDQFIDCVNNAGLAGEKIELRLDWAGRHDALERSNRPRVIVQLPRSPMGRTDGFGDELLPDCKRIQQCINLLRKHCLIVQVGKGTPLYRFQGIDVDLANRTTVRGLLDAAASASAFLGYCSFIAPLAESLNKPLVLIWSKRGQTSRNPFISQITPRKILHRQTSKAIRDDVSDDEMERAMNALLEQVRNKEMV